MAKTVPLTLRRPPEANPAGIDAFVRKGAVKRPDVQTSGRSSTQTSRAVITRADGRELRRMTVYLPVELAKRLRLHCAGADTDVSGFLGELIDERLNSCARG
jgi:hypothetical protein